MSARHFNQLWPRKWKTSIDRILWAESPCLPESNSDRIPFFPTLQKAWFLFAGLTLQDRWKLMGAYLLLSLAGFLKERTFLGGSWQDFWSWGIHFAVSVWALSFFAPPLRQGKPWWKYLPELILYVLLFEILCQGVWLLICYTSAVNGILVAWLLPKFQIPLLWGKISPDSLILILPALLFLGIGAGFLWFLLGFTFVVPLVLDRGAGLWPAVVSSLFASRGNRVRLLAAFLVVAMILGLPVLMISAGKLLVAVLPYSSFLLIPPSPLGVWICFALQTLVLLVGTILSVWIWPLGSALWAALYRVRYRPAGAHPSPG